MVVAALDTVVLTATPRLLLPLLLAWELLSLQLQARHPGCCCSDSLFWLLMLWQLAMIWSLVLLVAIWLLLLHVAAGIIDAAAVAAIPMVDAAVDASTMAAVA